MTEWFMRRTDELAPGLPDREGLPENVIGSATECGLSAASRLIVCFSQTPKLASEGEKMAQTHGAKGLP
jgi:hypothetical protein